MRAVVQRVNSARVEVDKRIVGEIGRGLPRAGPDLGGEGREERVAGGGDIVAVATASPPRARARARSRPHRLEDHPEAVNGSQRRRVGNGRRER